MSVFVLFEHFARKESRFINLFEIHSCDLTGHKNVMWIPEKKSVTLSAIIAAETMLGCLRL
jgi:hypothetical protein